MKSAISQDGTIGNFGDIQLTGLPLPDFTDFSSAIGPTGDLGGIAPVPEIPALVGGADQAPLLLTSGAGTAPGASDLLSAGAVVTSSDPLTYAPLVITPIFEASITNQAGNGSATNPTAVQIETAINAAVGYYDTHFSSSIPVGTTVNGTIVNAVSVTIDFGYGTVGASGAVAANDVSESNWGASPVGNFSALKAALSNVPTSADVLQNLPASDPTGGSGSFVMTTAQENMLGIAVSGNSAASPAGSVGLSASQAFAWDPANQSVSGDYAAVGAVEHEISEIFGRVSMLDGSANPEIPAPYYSMFDLYRFTAPATPALTAGASDYFSVNGGATASDYFNAYNGTTNLGDAGDWDSSGINSAGNDAFDASLPTGSSLPISNADTLALETIGFQPVCYLEGTRILTTRGERRIETLSVGDELPTLLGGSGRVVWLGRLAMDLTKHPKPWCAWPVRVCAGAFAPGLPMRDLYLSPDHAVYTGGVLIPVKLLINGSSIRQEKWPHVVYHHVELRQHDVIQAEGLPCETYLDAGDRDMFSGGAVTTLHPEFSARRWEMAACAPMVLTGAALEAARLRLARRSVDDRRPSLLPVAHGLYDMETRRLGHAVS